VTVVYLHALPLDERMWAADARAPRLYGRGRTMDEWARSVLDEVPGRLVLVGASMGGYCALAAARLAPERLAGLVLAGSRPDPDTPERHAKRAETIALARERGAEGIWASMREQLFQAGRGGGPRRAGRRDRPRADGGRARGRDRGDPRPARLD
jgi:pimeloyl-ACP methyl ester carboxylesterase